MSQIRQYAPETDREISSVLRRERQRKIYSDLGEVDDFDQRFQPQVCWVRTTTDTVNPTYPIAPANKFVVEFGDYPFDDTSVGLETLTFELNQPARKRIAVSHVGWIPQGLVVRASKHPVPSKRAYQWHIMPDQFSMIKGVVTHPGQISLGGSGEVTVWLKGQATAWKIPDAHLNWIATQAIANGKQIRAWWDWDDQWWSIINAAC